ncbi:MAG: PH domain-containing protein [Ruminococcus sp.]|nr:PH domain-containing protein [Ruminococcus sp.]
MHHEHPLRILRYSAKNIWLLIFPLLRGLRFIRFSKDWFYNWVKGAWFDILVVGIIVMVGLVRWYCSTIEISDSAIIHHDGLFFRLSKAIPYSKVSSATTERPFYLLPFNAVKLRCDTRAGIFKSTDMKLMLTEKTCTEIMKKMPRVDEENKIENIPKPTALSIILFSVFFSSGFSGTVYIAAFFFQGGNIARNIIGASLSRITEETSKFTHRWVNKIPDAAIIAGVFFICAWILSFIVNLLRYSKFSVSCDNKCFYTSYGILTKKEHQITASHINYTDLRQNLIMKFFEAVAVHISCAGYGVSRRSLPVLLPVRKEKNIGKDLEAIGVLSGVKNDFKPKTNGLWQYIWQPVILSASLFPIHFIVSYFFSSFSELTLFAAIMLSIPSIWFIIVKTAAFFTSGISIYDDKIMIRCCKWTGFHTVVAERKKLVKAELEQTIFQKIGGRCSVSLLFEGEEHIKYKVKAIDIKNAVKISELLDHNMEKTL